MPCKLNRVSYQQLIDENIKALKNEPSLEASHIETILQDSVKIYYDVAPAVERLLNGREDSNDRNVIRQFLNCLHDNA